MTTTSRGGGAGSGVSPSAAVEPPAQAAVATSAGVTTRRRTSQEPRVFRGIRETSGAPYGRTTSRSTLSSHQVRHPLPGSGVERKNASTLEQRGGLRLPLVGTHADRGRAGIAESPPARGRAASHVAASEHEAGAARRRLDGGDDQPLPLQRDGAGEDERRHGV